MKRIPPHLRINFIHLSPLIKRRKKVENVDVHKFFVRLCHDVLLEVLRYGNRRQLAALEKIGRRFCWFGDRYFKAAPFVLVNLEHTLSYLFFTSHN